MDTPVIASPEKQRRRSDEESATTASLPAVEQLVATVRKCLDTLSAIRPKGGPTSQSAATQAEYLKLAWQLIRQGNSADGGLVAVVRNTGRPTTFYKRLAALRYHCFHSIDVLATELPQALDATIQERLQASCHELLITMSALITLQRHTITATCFRHQWSADVKASGDGDAASRGLGHRSAKTRRHYGTAHQARGGHALRPVRIEANLPVKALQSQARPDVRAPRPE